MFSLILFCLIIAGLSVICETTSPKLLFIIFLVSAIIARIAALSTLDTLANFCQIYLSLVLLLLTPLLFRKKAHEPPS